MIVAQSRPTLCDPMDYTRQAPPSTGFLRQEYWSGLPFPSSGDLLDTRIEPVSSVLAGGFFTAESPASLLYFTCCDKQFLNDSDDAV